MKSASASNPHPMSKTIGKDVTEFARGIGYQGKKPVIVLDGKVISHRNVDWFAFCDRCRKITVRIG